jgi:hypothetical protein
MQPMILIDGPLADVARKNLERSWAELHRGRQKDCVILKPGMRLTEAPMSDKIEAVLEIVVRDSGRRVDLFFRDSEEAELACEQLEAAATNIRSIRVKTFCQEDYL